MVAVSVASRFSAILAIIVLEKNAILRSFNIQFSSRRIGALHLSKYSLGDSAVNWFTTRPVYSG